MLIDFMMDAFLYLTCHRLVGLDTQDGELISTQTAEDIITSGYSL